MVQQSDLPLAELFVEDETAWLEAMARLVSERRWGEIDAKQLSEYLTDMARRDRREVVSRMTVLIAHLLKWKYQPQQRSGSWHATMLHQRQELRDLLESGTLAIHANDVLEKTYERAVKMAALECSIGEDQFASTCPWSVDDLIADSAFEE